MNIEEYITTLTEQIRWKQARQGVAQEIRDHICDQAQAFEQSGIEHDKAIEMAVCEMGDPVETGVAFDRIHRPQFDWRLFLLTAVFSIAGIFLMYVTGALDAGSRQLMRQCIFTFLGLGLTLLVYFMDYTFIGRYALQIYTAISIAFIFYFKTGIKVNGSILALKSLVYLYVPVYAGILYRYRGKRFGSMIKSGLFMILTVILAQELASSTFVALNIGVICTFLFLYAVYKNWFSINRKRTMVLIILSVILAMFLAVYMLFFAYSYQKQRLLAFFNQNSYIYEANYQLTLVRNVLMNARLIGGNTENMLERQLVQNDTFLIFAQTVAIYGMAAGAAIITAFAVFACRALNIVRHQKNQLGMMMSAACFLVIMFHCAEGVLMNFGLFPMSTLQLPFLSTGGSAAMMYAVIIGLLMSCRRYSFIPCTDNIKIRKIQANSDSR